MSTRDQGTWIDPKPAKPTPREAKRIACTICNGRGWVRYPDEPDQFPVQYRCTLTARELARREGA